MHDAETILIIILAATLIVFLLTLIIGLIYVIKVLRNLRRITETAEKVVDSAEAVGEVFKNTSGKIPLFRLLYNIVDNARSKRK